MKLSRLAKGLLLGAALATVSYTASAGVFLNVNLTNTITATMDGGLTKSGDTWYQSGVNATNPASGINLGLVTGQYDAFSTYLFRPANTLNALMLDNSATTGELTFARPVSVTGLSFAASSGHGSATNVLTLRFSDGSATTTSIVIGDWFNNDPRVQTANGRFNIFNNTFNNVNSDNPRILAVNTALAPADQSKFLTGIGLSWTGSAANTVTAIFGVSGDVTGIGHYTAIPLTDASFTQDMIVGLSEIPEPSTFALMGLGLAVFFARARRQNN